MTTPEAQAPPINDEARAANAGHEEKQETNQRSKYVPVAPATASLAAANDPDAERDRVAVQDKAIQTLQARAALLAWQLHVVGPGTLLAARWGRSTPDMTLAEAEAFVDQLEAHRAR